MLGVSLATWTIQGRETHVQRKEVWIEVLIGGGWLEFGDWHRLIMSVGQQGGHVKKSGAVVWNADVQNRLGADVAIKVKSVTGVGGAGLSEMSF
jgi:hypothetical protein